MSNLKELISKCRYSVEITANGHRDESENISDYLNRFFPDGIFENDISEGIYEEIIDSNEIVLIIAYPRNSVGFIRVFHYDVEEAISEALSLIEN